MKTPRNVLLEVSRILNTILEYRRLYQQQQPSTATLSATSAASTPLLKFDEIKMERLVNGVAVDVMYKMRKQDKEAREMALPYMQETVELAGRADSVYRDICSLDGEAQLLEEVKQRWIDLLT